MTKRPAQMGPEELFSKLEAQITAKINNVTAGLDAQLSKWSGEIRGEIQGSQQKMAAGFSDVTKKIDVLAGELRTMRGVTDRLTTEVAQLKTAINSTALLEERFNVLHMAGIPFNGPINNQTVAAAVKRALGEAGAALSSTAMAENAVWSLSMIRCFANKKKPGTVNAVVKVLTADERYVLLSPQVTSNLQAKGISIGTCLYRPHLRRDPEQEQAVC